MSKTEQIHVRVEPETKQRVGQILAALDLTLSDAIALYMRQIIIHRGLPFELRLPNAETRAAMDELDKGDGVETDYAGFSAMLDKLK